MSLRLGLSLVQSGQWALENAAALRKPTLLLHGARDVLTCPQATIEFADRSGDWSTLRIYPGLLHDLHYEPEWMAVLDDLRRWLADQALGAQEHRAAA
jgi:acylglycerol lipase